MTDDFSPRRILITGARGMLGREVARMAMESHSGAETVCVGRRPAVGDQPPGPVLDLARAGDWNALAGDFDTIFHLAAEIPKSEGEQRNLRYLRNNEHLASNLWEFCRRAPPRCLVYASSISVYPMGLAPTLHEGLVPRPDSPYGIGKLAGEYILSLAGKLGTRVSCLRFSSIFGPGGKIQGVLQRFVNRALAKQPLELYGDGKRTQDFLYVTDAARAVFLAAANGAEGVFNIGSGKAVTMADLAARVSTLPGQSDIDILHKDKPETAPSVSVDIRKARDAFGFLPRVSLDEGLRRYRDELLVRKP